MPFNPDQPYQPASAGASDFDPSKPYALAAKPKDIPVTYGNFLGGSPSSPEKDTTTVMSDDPNKTYDKMLPIAINKQTGAAEFAAPEMLRGVVQDLQRTEKAAGKPVDQRTPADYRAGLGAAALGVGGASGQTAKAMTGEGTAMLSKLPDAAAEGVMAAASKGAKLLSSEDVKTSKDVAAAANTLYKTAREKGGMLTPEFVGKFVSRAAEMEPQTFWGKLVAGPSETTDLVARLRKYQSEPMGLDDAKEVDQQIGNLIDKQYNNKNQLSDEGRKLVQFQRDFRSLIDTAGPGEIAGGKEGFDALKQGRKAWSQAMKMRDVERVVTRAENSENPTTVLRTGLRHILENTRGWTPDEVRALQSATDRGAAAGLVRILASKITAPAVGGLVGVGIGGEVGGGLGALAGSAVADQGKQLAMKVQMGRVNRLMNTLGQNYPAAQDVLYPQSPAARALGQ